MSRSESPTAGDVYERNPEIVEEIAEEDDGIMGAAARAVIKVAQENGDDD